jgi:hypothetical protein
VEVSFKFQLGQIVSWRLVPGSRVIVTERIAREVGEGLVVREYAGNLRADAVVLREKSYPDGVESTSRHEVISNERWVFIEHELEAT